MPQLLGFIGLAFGFGGFWTIDHGGVYVWTLAAGLDFATAGILILAALMVRSRTRPLVAIGLVVAVAAAIALGALLFPQPQGVNVLMLFAFGLLLLSANSIRRAPERFDGGRYRH
jgi:uncharacterized membrane protein